MKIAKAYSDGSDNLFFCSVHIEKRLRDDSRIFSLEFLVHLRIQIERF